MSRSVVVQPRARADLAEIAAWLGEQSWDAADRFLTEAEQAIRGLGEFAETGRVFETREPRLFSIRHRPIRGFDSYLLFYIVGGREVYVVRVLHGARDLPSLFDEG